MASPTPAPCRSCGQVWSDDVLTCPTDGSQLPLEGRLLGDKFRLEKRLGSGGMATVWQATHELIQRPVAIKLMHARYAADAELLARFRNEATAAGRIGSPHICDVLDFGRSPIGPYIVMELLSGCSLSDLIHAYQTLDAGLAVWIVRQALDGLDAAHRAGIIHRDLKPENIYLCRAIRDQWVVKLMDFGISKFTDSLRTGAGTMMGSPNYMAPEQIRGAAGVDARADVWSCGAILHEAITGESPFARSTIADSLAAVRSFDPPPIHTRAAAVPPGLSDVVARALAKQPEQRWPTARALADALAPFERRGGKMREPPPEPRGDAPRASTTMRKSGAAPRALLEHADPIARVASARAGERAGSGSGPYPPVSAARSPADRGSGPFPPVSAARSSADRGSGPYPPVSPPAARARASGAFPAVPSARPPHDPPKQPSGSHAPVPPASPARQPSGAHAPVPAARSPGDLQRPPVRAPLPAVTAPVRKDARPTPVTIPTGGFKPVPKSIAARGQPARSGEIATGPQAPERKPARPPAGDDITRPRLKPPGPDQRPLLIALLIAAVGAALAVITWLAL
jgi:serine/threonine protein kinase